MSQVSDLDLDWDDLEEDYDVAEDNGLQFCCICKSPVYDGDDVHLDDELNPYHLACARSVGEADY